MTTQTETPLTVDSIMEAAKAARTSCRKFQRREGVAAVALVAGLLLGCAVSSTSDCRGFSVSDWILVGISGVSMAWGFLVFLFGLTNNEFSDWSRAPTTDDKSALVLWYLNNSPTILNLRKVFEWLREDEEEALKAFFSSDYQASAGDDYQAAYFATKKAHDLEFDAVRALHQLIFEIKHSSPQADATLAKLLALNAEATELLASE